MGKVECGRIDLEDIEVVKLIIEKLDVQDEVLSGEPRYEIKDNNGNVIATNCSIELITSVLQEGTPLNKALFDRLDNVLVVLGGKENGEDFKKYIETGEYGGLKTPELLDELYELKGLWQQQIETNISSLKTSISSLNTRVTALEG